LVETVTVYRDDSRPGVQVEITGRLNSLLGDQAFPNGIRAMGGLMVAEEGFKPRHKDYDLIPCKANLLIELGISCAVLKLH
jgi:hypothetical protein